MINHVHIEDFGADVPRHTLTALVQRIASAWQTELDAQLHVRPGDRYGSAGGSGAVIAASVARLQVNGLSDGARRSLSRQNDGVAGTRSSREGYGDGERDAGRVRLPRSFAGYVVDETTLIVEMYDGERDCGCDLLEYDDRVEVRAWVSVDHRDIACTVALTCVQRRFAWARLSRPLKGRKVFDCVRGGPASAIAA